MSRTPVIPAEKKIRIVMSTPAGSSTNRRTRRRSGARPPNGVSDGFSWLVSAADIRSATVIAKAFSGGFHLVTQHVGPVPLGSRDVDEPADPPRVDGVVVAQHPHVVVPWQSDPVGEPHGRSDRRQVEHRRTI